jgi:hypothetical protein
MGFRAKYTGDSHEPKPGCVGWAEHCEGYSRIGDIEYGALMFCPDYLKDDPDVVGYYVGDEDLEEVVIDVEIERRD